MSEFGPPERPKLVDAKRLLEILFDESCRPSLRWVRNQQAKRTIPYKKIGRLVFFDVEEVRQAMDNWRVGRVRSLTRWSR